VVVGRTAGAVGGIADSGLMMRMTRGRAWIAVLGMLLVGIVGINVWALSLNASSSKVAAQTDGLKRANSALQAQIAGELSNEEVQATAMKLGLFVPEPGAIRYLHTGDDAAALAAKRLAAGELTFGAEAPAVAPTTETAAPVADPAAPVDPATVTDPAATAPPAAPTEETALAPAAASVAAAPAASTAGGVPTP
jgi:hypothetical protein